MKIAVTGASGLIGAVLAGELARVGHQVVAIARGSDGRQEKLRGLANVKFTPLSITDGEALAAAFGGCEAVAHCAGINREADGQTYQSVHVKGTECVVRAAQEAKVKRIAMVSFLRARASCGSPYHETKWAAEEMVRNSGLEFAVLKCGIVYGPGDHLLHHISGTIAKFPVFATVGMKGTPVAPVAVEDVTRILRGALVEGKVRGKTVAVIGPERLDLGEAVERIAKAMGRTVHVMKMPVWFHRTLAAWCERRPGVPLISMAQVRILEEGVVEPLPGTDELSAGLKPSKMFTEEQILAGLDY